MLTTIGEKTDMKIVRWTGDQVPAVSCVVSTVQLKWQVTMVSREETMPVMSRWNGQIVLIASTISNGQSTQIVHRGQIDQRDMTDPDIISSGGKMMLIGERGQAPKEGRLSPTVHFQARRAGLTARSSKFRTLQPSVFSLLCPIRLESSHGNPPL
jgi:hypothetical protein